jgi:hypothetical protein
LLLVLSCPVAACQSPYEFTFFGYSMSPRHSTCIRTVRVPLFKNKTYVRGLEIELTEAVVKRMHQVTPWRVVQSGAADAELIGTIIAVAKRPILMNELNEVREADLALGVEIEFRGANGQPLWLAPQGEESTAPPMYDGDSPKALPGALLPATGRTVFIQRSAPFVPELGQSYASARSKVVQELAVEIVNILEDPW